MLHIHVYTFIYSHINQYTSYTPIYRNTSYTPYFHIPSNSLIYPHIPTYTSKSPKLTTWGPTWDTKMAISRAPARFQKWEFDTMILSMSQWARYTQQSAPNIIEITSFKKPGEASPKGYNLIHNRSPGGRRARPGERPGRVPRFSGRPAKDHSLLVLRRFDFREYREPYLPDFATLWPPKTFKKRLF